MARPLILLLLAVAACGPAARGSDDDGGGDDGGSCGPSCSADQRQVLDCHGDVVETCSADAACGAGACVDPCAAAAVNKSSIGCDYYSVAPDVIAEDAGGCFAAFIANTWPSPVTITVDRGGAPLPVTAFGRIPSGQGQGLTYAPLANGALPPGEVAILFLSRFGTISSDCPSGISPAVTTPDPAVHGTGRGQAFHITTSAPTVAYDIYPYGGGSSAVTSATLLLPTSAWDTNYLAVDAYAKSYVPQANPFVEVVAQQDATTVTIRPVVAIDGGGGVPASPAQTPASFTLNAGEVLQLTQPAELAGSPISADKPIGVWGGASCLNIETDVAACDSAHQQIPNTKALGYRYAAVRYRNRFPGVEETVPWRVVGAVDGTTLTYAPAAPPGAPTTLALGQVVTFSTAQPFVVTSQDAEHPFYVSGYMTGCDTYSELGDCRGDPEYVNVVPLDQYLPTYTFFTDPTYPETSLVLTRERKDGAFADVTLDCLGTVTGWTPIDAGDTIELARVDLVTGNFMSVNGCNNGRHIATSALPFGLVVWGWGSSASAGFFSQAVSYAYPAGASVKPINNVVIF
jgi:hypothetical protein